MKTLPQQVNKMMTQSKSVLSLKQRITELTLEMAEMSKERDNVKNENEYNEKHINKLKKEKLVLESLIKKKTYEIEELERNHFLKVEGLKDIYEKKICYLETSIEEEKKRILKDYSK
jgi:predicted transcriptional regulator